MKAEYRRELVKVQSGPRRRAAYALRELRRPRVHHRRGVRRAARGRRERDPARGERALPARRRPAGDRRGHRATAGRARRARPPSPRASTRWPPLIAASSCRRCRRPGRTGWSAPDRVHALRARRSRHVSTSAARRSSRSRPRASRQRLEHTDCKDDARASRRARLHAGLPGGGATLRPPRRCRAAASLARHHARLRHHRAHAGATRRAGPRPHGRRAAEVDIRAACRQHIKDIGLDPRGPRERDLPEPAGARAHPGPQLDLANLEDGALQVGTGDLSEMALGWSTFGGDQISMYNVNAGRAQDAGARAGAAGWPSTRPPRRSATCCATCWRRPVSPELVLRPGRRRHHAAHRGDRSGPTSCTTSTCSAWSWLGAGPAKILFLAEHAFRVALRPSDHLKRWLRVVPARGSSQNQFKRSVAPDGPKVGSVSLSPRRLAHAQRRLCSRVPGRARHALIAPPLKDCRDPIRDCRFPIERRARTGPATEIAAQEVVDARVPSGRFRLPADEEPGGLCAVPSPFEGER